MTRLRLNKQLEKSTTIGSVVVTDSSNEQKYLAPGSNGQLLTVVAGEPAWSTITFPSEYDQYANIAALPVTGSTDVIYYATAENKFLIWNGSAYVQVPSNPSFTAAGNSGTSQVIASGDTLNILASLGFTSVASATGNITITPPSGTVTGQVLTWNNTTSLWAAASASSTFTVAGDAGTNQTITGGDTLTIKGATSSGVLVTGVATDTVEISLREQTDVFTPAAAATTVTLSQTPISTTNLQIFRNGQLQALATDYTISGVTVTVIDAFGASSGGTLTEIIIAKYRY